MPWPLPSAKIYGHDATMRGFRTELHGLPHGLASHPAGCPIYLPSRCGRQAVQAETLHTATVEAIYFANCDAAVATQRWRLPASRAARRMRSPTG